MVYSLSWFALTAVSSGSTRHHGVESPSLLQSVVSDHHFHPHKGIALPLIQSHNSLQSIEKYVSKLESKLQEASPNATHVLTTDDLKRLVDLITAMDSEFVAELMKQSDADQAAFLRKKVLHEACHAHLQMRLAVGTGDVWKAEQKLSPQRAKHKACRRAEKSLMSYTDQAAPVGGGVWGNLARVTGGTQLPQDETLCSSRDTFVSDLSAYENIVPTGISSSCVEDQMLFETGMCNWLQGKTSACIGFDECLVSVGLATLKYETEASSNNRQAVFLSIEKLKCRLQHVHDAFEGGASSFTTTDTCGDTEDPEPTKFTLMLEVPTYAGCSTDADIVNPVQPSIDVEATCTDWRQQEFNADDNVSHTYDLKKHTSVASCKTSCELPTEIVNPNIVEGCVDRNDAGKLCPFYDLHFDACGKYNEDATLICCACGGGDTDGGDGGAPDPDPVCNSNTTQNIALKTEGANCTLGAPSNVPEHWPDSHDCSSAIDGSENWHNVEGGHEQGVHMKTFSDGDQWLMVEFPKKMIVDVIKLYQFWTETHKTFVLPNIKYQTRDNDGVTWTTQFTELNEPKNGMEPVQLAKGTVTDAVRIVGFEKTKLSGLYRIVEIVVEGCPV